MLGCNNQVTVKNTIFLTEIDEIKVDERLKTIDGSSMYGHSYFEYLLAFLSRSFMVILEHIWSIMNPSPLCLFIAWTYNISIHI